MKIIDIDKEKEMVLVEVLDGLDEGTEWWVQAEELEMKIEE